MPYIFKVKPYIFMVKLYILVLICPLSMGSLQGDDFVLLEKRMPKTTKLTGEKNSLPSTELCVIDDSPLHTQTMEIDSQPVSIPQVT